MSIIAAWQPSTIYLKGSLVKPTSFASPVLGVIGNPGFESGDSGWTKDTGFTIDNTAAFEGSWSAEYLNASADGELTNNTFSAVVPGQKVTAKCRYFYDLVAPIEGRVKINWYTSGDVFISASVGAREIKLPGQWQDLYVTGTAPATAAKAKVVAFGGRNSVGTRFDDFSWNLVSSGTPVASGLVFKATQTDPGLSDSDEPTWPTVAGNTVVDNEVTWEAVEASTVTWEASSILTSGATEPTWPTTKKALVVDNDIVWETVPLHIEDENCPHTKEVAIAASKVFAGDDDITRFSATLNARDWSSRADAGFLPTGLHQAGEVGVSALGVYRSNLCVWSPSTFQMWQVDPDPASMALLDVMEGIGSLHQRAVMPVANDLFFLAALGVRTVAIAAGASNLAAHDAGIPIDVLIQAELDGTVDPVAMYYPAAGQYWIAFPPAVATVPGHVDQQPVATFDPVGVCATIDDLTQGDQILSPHPLQIVTATSHVADEGAPDSEGWSLDPSKTVSATFAFARSAVAGSSRYIIDVRGSSFGSKFGVSLNTSGFIDVLGHNAAGTKILDCQIMNNGVSFADSGVHLISFVANLDDPTKREVFVSTGVGGRDGLNVTDNPAYVTWNTYTDDLLALGDGADGIGFRFGVAVLGPGVSTLWGDDDDVDSLGYICLDNRCTLVGQGLWDANGYVMDPQGDFTGWFTSQPRIAFGPSLYRQCGEFTGFEAEFDQVNGSYFPGGQMLDQELSTRINGDTAGATDPLITTDDPPPATPPPTTLISLPSPHWNYLSGGMSYNYVNRANYTQKTYAQLTGQAIDANNFTEQLYNIGSGVAASFSTTDPDNNVTIVYVPSWFNKAAIVLTDNDGVIVDWCSVFNTAVVNNGAIQIPSDGATYWLVMTSDAGRINVRRWDTS